MSTTTATAPPRTIHPLTIWVPIIIMALGLVVFWNYLITLQRQKDAPHLPVISRLEKNLTFTERSGKTVELKDLQGKVIVACYVYTHCPRGCPGVVGQMLKLYKDMGSDPNVHFLSVSVDPDDTPAALSTFTEKFNIKGDNWWFVNGPKEGVRPYMTRYFRFQEVKDVPEAERMSPDDKFVHDMKVILVDSLGQVRGTYDIGSPDPTFAKYWQETIRKDIKTLLEERAADQK